MSIVCCEDLVLLDRDTNVEKSLEFCHFLLCHLRHFPSSVAGFHSNHSAPCFVYFPHVFFFQSPPSLIA